MIVVVLLMMLAGTAYAQDGPPMPKLAGTTWQRISEAKDVPPSYLIFGNDGYYMQVGFRDDRPKLTKPLANLSKTELLAQLRGGEARVGRYSLVGSRLSRTYLT